MDFSMANLTFNGTDNITVHTQNEARSNQYRDIMHMMSQTIYSSELYLPIFGFGATTFTNSNEAAPIFPLSLTMANPLIPNQKENLNEAYNKCL